MNRPFGKGISSALALALAATAFAEPRESVTFNNVVSEGLNGDFGNSVVTHAFTGAYTATKLRLNGTLNSTTPGTWPDDSRIEVTTPTGQILTIHPFTDFGGFTSISTPGDILIDLPAPIGAAGTWTFRFYESYDDEGVDALWEPVTFTLDDAAPPPPAPPPTFAEVEPNDSKFDANNVNSIAAGNTIGGTATGSDFDYFKIKTPAAPLGIYRHRIAITTTGPVGHTCTIRGLEQDTGFILSGTDATVQTSATGTTPARAIQWYGFGRQEELYVRVAGTASTGGEYRGTYSVEPASFIDAGSFITGDITITRGPTNFIDADFMVYDSTMTALPGYSNDGGNVLTRDFPTGTYYIAFSDFNTANDQAAPADDTFPSENVMDFPHVLANNSTAVFSDNSITITDVAGNPAVVNGSKDGFFDITWFKIVVAPPTGPISPRGIGDASPNFVQITGSTLLTVQAFPGLNPPSTGLQVRADLTAINGSSTQTFYDDGSHGDDTPGDNVFSFLATLAEPMSPGDITIPFTVSDAQLRSRGGNIELTATAAPEGGCCAAAGCSIATAYACGQSGGSYRGDSTNCGEPSYAISTTNNAMVSITGSGNIAFTVSDCDDCTEVVSLPFTFNHFGAGYNEVRISSNGNLQFGASASAAYTNGPIPVAGGPDNAIYPLWDDYNPGELGDVYYTTEGVAPNRVFIVEWSGVTQYTAAGAWSQTSETFQALLFEGSNSVEFRYGSITPVNTSGVDQGFGQDASGGDRTIGMENADGTTAYSHPSATHSGESLLVTFSPAVNPCGSVCGTSDFNGDGDFGTDADIEAFFACLAGNCCPSCWHLGADFNADGDTGTDADIEAFFRVLAGNNC